MLCVLCELQPIVHGPRSTACAGLIGRVMRSGQLAYEVAEVCDGPATARAGRGQEEVAAAGQDSRAAGQGRLRRALCGEVVVQSGGAVEGQWRDSGGTVEGTVDRGDVVNFSAGVM